MENDRKQYRMFSVRGPQVFICLHNALQMGARVAAIMKSMVDRNNGQTSKYFLENAFPLLARNPRNPNQIQPIHFFQEVSSRILPLVKIFQSTSCS